MTTTIQRLQNWWRRGSHPATEQTIDLEVLDRLVADGQRELNRRCELGLIPRIALVKQDVCEDLYCEFSTAAPRRVLESTQLRSGPVALLSPLRAQFHILETVEAPECQIWQERARDLHWDTLEFFSSYRDRIPGRDYGQLRYAVAHNSIDWSQYDIVISVDVAVPAAITRQFPSTAWAYFVREIKAPSYSKGLQSPASGQDFFLNHGFRWSPPTAADHVLEFPYHLQYSGCFHELFGVPWNQPRSGIFVDHHTLVTMTDKQRQEMQHFGEIVGPILPTELRLEGGKSVPPRRTMDPDLRERLLTSKYFLITPGQRRVHGTALVEAIAAGCLAIGSPTALQAHGFVFSSATCASTVEEAVERMHVLETDSGLYQRELQRQRQLIDWLCYLRPTLALFEKAEALVARRTRV
jgi:hypothetical protein